MHTDTYMVRQADLSCFVSLENQLFTVLLSIPQNVFSFLSVCLFVSLVVCLLVCSFIYLCACPFMLPVLLPMLSSVLHVCLADYVSVYLFL